MPGLGSRPVDFSPHDLGGWPKAPTEVRDVPRQCEILDRTLDVEVRLRSLLAEVFPNIRSEP